MATGSRVHILTLPGGGLRPLMGVGELKGSYSRATVLLSTDIPRLLPDATSTARHVSTAHTSRFSEYTMPRKGTRRAGAGPGPRSMTTRRSWPYRSADHSSAARP